MYGSQKNNRAQAKVTATKTAKKAKGLDWQNNNSARASRFFCTFLCRLYTTTKSKFPISLFVEDMKTRQRYSPLEPQNSTLEKFANIFRIERDVINAIKLEAVRIYFLSDVFVAVAIVVA